jgi:hypothetical protein
METEISQDIGSDILLALDRIKLKIMERKLEVMNEKECTASPPC